MANSYPHSIPTPPFSPLDHQTQSQDSIDNPLKATINLLDSLVAFYQHERMWVYRTRAMLEDAFQDQPSFTFSSGSDRENASHSLSSAGIPSITLSGSGSVIAESDTSDNASPAPEQPPSRWMRRKKMYKLRLDGIASRNRRVLTAQAIGHRQPHDDIQPKERILEMFESMMAARMESCQRINKLVRNANRANLRLR